MLANMMVSVAAPAILKLGEQVGKVGIVHDGVRKKKTYISQTRTYECEQC